MNSFSRTRTVLRWLIAAVVLTAAAVGASRAIHPGSDDDARQQLGSQSTMPLPNVLTGGMIDRSVLERLEDDAASNNPGQSVAAYDE